MHMRIGIFDTGLGGELVAGRLRTLLPQHDYLLAHDRANLPYGLRNHKEITELTDAALQPLLSAGCDAIVLACNTATAAAIDTLRQRYPARHFVGFEPMIKPAAALSHAGTVAILATPATLRSERYKKLKDRWAGRVRIIEPDCGDWAAHLENGRQPESYERVVDELIASGSDIVALACTHYLALQQDIARHTGLRVIEPTGSVARRLIDLTGLRPRPRRLRPAQRN